MSGPWEDFQPPKKEESSGGPWDDFAKSKETSAGQSALESFGNAATLGYLPHLQAMAAPAMDRILDAVTGQNVADSDESTYIKRRDENIARQELQKEEHPIATGVGTGAGILASAVGTGGLGAVAKGASGVQRLKAASRAGAALGALANPGDVQGEGNPLQIGDRARNAVVGGVLGTGGQLIAEGAGVAAGAASRGLKKFAGKKAFRALGLGKPAQTEALAKSGRDVQIGQELLDSGAIPVLGTTSRISKRVSAAKEQADEAIGEILSSSGKGEAVFDAETVALKLLDSPDLAVMRKTPGMESTVRTIEDAAETLATNGKLSLEEANKLKRAIDGSINYNKKIPDMAGKQEGLFKARTAVRDEMNDLVNQMNPGQAKDQLLKANRKSGDLATAEEILEREMGREQRNRMVSLTDTIAAGSGMAIGDTPEERMIYGVLLGALNKGGRKFGNSIQARGANALSKQLAKIPQFSGIAEKNPAAFSAMVQRVSEKIGLSGSTPAMQPRFADSGPESEREPASKGPDKWANDGLKKLGISGPQADRLLKSKEGKRLLIEASDLKPGSRAMQRIQERIQKLGASK